MSNTITCRIRCSAAFLYGAGIATVIGASSAFAQSLGATGQTASEQVTTLSEIVVTAERRSETVQTATQSITALSGAELQASGVNGLEQIADEVPGMSEKNNGPGQTEYEMRGVASSGGSAPTVGFYLDDVPLTAPSGSDVDRPVVDPNLYDLNRVEVLRGPQGTLYGSSSMGGTIRLITNEPDTHAFAASAQATGSDTDGGGLNGGVNAMLNMPLVQDKLALRLVGTDDYTSGWIDRVYLANFPLPTDGGLTRGNVLAVTPTDVDKDANWETTKGGRAELLWQPIDNLTVSPTVLYQKLNQGGQNQADVPPGADYEAHYQPFDVAEPSSDEFELATLPIKYNLDEVQLNAITGYYHRKNSVTQENTEDLQDYFQVDQNTPLTFAQLGPLVVNNSSYDSQVTQELRISSTNDDPFQWLAGFYFQDFDSRFVIQTNNANALFDSARWYYSTATQKTTQYAGFGEVSYKLGNFKLTGGFRAYTYHESFVSYQYGLFAGVEPPEATPQAATAKASGGLPRINLGYLPNPDLTLYAQAAKGFRPGSPIGQAPAACGAQPTSYAPDDVWSYEGGEKARVLDQRLTINSDAYYEDWQNIQQLVNVYKCGFDYTGNAGTAHIRGAEAEASLRLTSELMLRTGLAYTDAKLSSLPQEAIQAGFFVGERIQGVPEWSDTSSLIYTHQLNDGYAVVFRATDEYVGNQVIIVNSLYQVPSHNFLNMRLGLSSENWGSAWLFVNNVANSRTILNEGQPISVFVPSVVRAIVPQPRTIGIELNYAR